MLQDTSCCVSVSNDNRSCSVAITIHSELITPNHEIICYKNSCYPSQRGVPAEVPAGLR